MKKFIKISTCFTLLLSLVIIALMVFTESKLSQEANFKLIAKPKYVILGHSHPECAYNDTLINNLQNLSQSGESYFYTYFKTKEILDQNPSIKVVFIEYTNNQINQSMNNWIWGEKYMNHRYPKYSPFMNFSDKQLLAKNNLNGYFNATSLSFNYNFNRVATQNYNYTESIGGYIHLKRDKTDSLVNTINNIPDVKSNLVSNANINYLTKIINYCKEKDKKVILIRSPQHKMYNGYTNEDIYQKIRKEFFPSVSYLDFSQFPLKNSEFGDLEHLNHKGAKVFSKWFSMLLKNGLIEQHNPQTIINDEIKVLTLLESNQKK